MGTGGCRRKGNALASRCAHQGIIVWGSTLVSAAVRAWLVRERTCCRRWQRREEGEVRACSGFHGGFAAASPERSATCVTGRSCPLGRSRPPTGVLAVLPPRFVAPGFLPCCSAVRIEGNAAHFGAGHLVAAGEVDGVEEALRSGREEGVGGFKRSYGVPLPLVRSMRALRACPGAGGAGFTNQGLPTAP